MLDGWTDRCNLACMWSEIRKNWRSLPWLLRKIGFRGVVSETLFVVAQRLASTSFNRAHQSHWDGIENLKRGPLYAHELSSLSACRCPACEGDDLWLLGYPYSISPQFSRLVVLLCRSCGLGWVPVLPFDLDDYYRSQYAVENRRDRDIDPALYFSDKDSLLAPQTNRLRNYFGRARQQIELARRYLSRIGAMLDYGSGPGYALHVAQATTKHAIEPDLHSRKYLDYLGAEVVKLETLPEGFYDLILSSHSLEHVPIENVFSVLAAFHRALKPEGVLLIEVPGAYLGRCYVVSRHEPHTLFFSPKSLTILLEKAGFEVVHAGARSPKKRKPLSAPLVQINEQNPWEAELGGGLQVIARRQPKMITSISVLQPNVAVLGPT